MSVLWNYCINCKKDTKHSVVCEKKNISEEDYFHWEEYYEILECNGCGRNSFRYKFVDIESGFQGEEFDPTISIETYPLSFKNHTPLKNTYELPPKIRLVYMETQLALQTNSYLLASAGFRAIIEAICLQHNIKGKLVQQIDKLAQKGFLTRKEADRLHSIRFLGNDSLHDITVPSENQVRLVLRIIEHLLTNLYLLDKEIQGHLETVINTYDEFSELVWKRIFTINEGEEITIKDILGNHVRRVGDKLKEFEKELVAELTKSFKLIPLDVVVTPATDKEAYVYKKIANII